MEWARFDRVSRFWLSSREAANGRVGIMGLWSPRRDGGHLERLRRTLVTKVARDGDRAQGDVPDRRGAAPVGRSVGGRHAVSRVGQQHGSRCM